MFSHGGLRDGRGVPSGMKGLTMRILITGSNGQLGNELQRLLTTGTSEIGPIPASYRDAEVDAIDLPELDISSWEAVSAWFVGHEPYDLVINCAAMTNVDGCETNWQGAFAANALGPQNLALATAAQGAKLVHVSTDYVFPGTDPTPRTEADVPAPISAYGRTKLAGEGLARANNPRTFVVRTAWLYGYVGHNFVKTMLRLAETHDYVTVVDDQLGNPTSANDLAHEVLAIAATDNYGTYHCTNEGICSWAQFAAAVMEEFGTGCEVVPCTSEEYKRMVPGSADRPHFSALENAHLASTIGNEMRPWRDALATYRRNFVA